MRCLTYRVQRVDDPQALRRLCDGWAREGQHWGFVPTMGALHDGHLQLVRSALQQHPKVVVSVFVNPTQFGPNEDFERYPRRLEDDAQKLQALGVHALFAPPATAVYPADPQFTVQVGSLGQVLEGTTRPHFFHGVATVVLKLLNMVRPHSIYLGAKDYQQTVVLRRLVEEFFLEARVVVVPTVREADGLALSSRNELLDARLRAKAPMLHNVLQHIARNRTGFQTLADARQWAANQLAEAGDFRLDYLELADPDTLAPIHSLGHSGPMVLLLAAWLGSVRLIDNLLLEPNPAP